MLQEYQSMIDDAKSYLNDQAKRPIIADHLLQDTSNTQNMVAREKRSIERCLHICNQALAFTMTWDFQVQKGQPTFITSISELLPEERRCYAMHAHRRSTAQRWPGHPRRDPIRHVKIILYFWLHSNQPLPKRFPTGEGTTAHM